ncbi:MAG: Ribosome-binding factor A [Candidatus Magnetoglobus multicellularis str. Araruama]|uniref:Ribosome-binding factor A n=1 Tax=Candidatus Magnetoglobus multicellularis str. Araruama TaxID=890399 RepID=A0A1V1PB83_9BACT|nr:MAG: Ribosome-binding factor A [Candidatus Magnetoglobus multicellularis str. Araruama]
MKTYPRSERVSSKIREQISRVLLRDVKDPRIKNVTITAVKMNNDLKKARVYYCLAGDDIQKQNASKGLKSALGFIKREVAGRLDLRYMPDIQFLFDESMDTGSKMDQLFEKIKHATKTQEF